MDTFSALPGVTDESIAVWQAEARKVELVAPPNKVDDQAMFEQLWFF